ncbi:MAG: hypothetical protein NT062_30475 [Proteobacteria bacterium]|nr:hypothetical protein [Pseudomonadota bacterium]
MGRTSGFDWAALYDPEDREGAERFAAQYVNTPTSLSDRYVLAPPMTNRYRLKTNETRFANLYLTGDWIKTSLSIGCLEAAAMAGIQTARAISLERGGRVVRRAHGDWIEDVAVRGSRTTAPPASPTSPARNTLDVVKALVHGVLDRGRALAHDLMTVVTGPAAPTPPPPPPRRPVTYVRRDSELLGRPPFELRCDNLFLFVLRANRGRLQRICDRELNLGPTRYTPVGDTVVLYAATLTNLAMGTTCRSSEVGIWMPIESDGAAIHTYSPYVWIDSGTSMIGGRGIYGYTKQPSQVTVPSRGQPSRIAVTSDALVAASARGAWRIEPSPLLTIEPLTAAPWTPPHQDLSSWIDLTRLVANFIGPNPERLTAMMSAGMKSIFLKQLPDIDGERAAYQAIVEASITPAIGTVRGVSMNSTPWSIAIPAYHAPNIVDTLGLEATVTSNHELLRTATVTPTAQVWMQFEGRLDPGVEIWRAG